MSYIGRGLQSGAFRQLDDISSGFDGSDTTHTMQVNSTNVSVGDVNQILLSLGGVIQKPGTDFTVSGSTLTFTTAPAANTSFFAILLGSDNGGTVTPTDGSVTGDKVASTGAFTIGAAGTASSLAGIPFYNGDTTSIYTHDVSGTESTAQKNTAYGLTALDAITTGDSNTTMGYNSAGAINSGSYNNYFGEDAGKTLTTGSNNTGIGYQAGGAEATMTGSENTCLGNYAGFGLTSGSSNVILGYDCAHNLSSGSNNIMIGNDAGTTGSPGGNIGTGSNNLHLGDENISSCQIQTDWTVASDQRDKTDFTALDIGLDFVNDLKPYTYKWDKRIKYVSKENRNTVDLDSITHDGTHKEGWLDIGFKAQDVEALEKAAGYKISDKTNLTTSLTEDGKQYGIKYSNFVPILVKAIQELSTKVKALEEA